MGDAVARRQDQDRRGVAALAQGLEDLETIAVGQGEIEDAGVIAGGAEGGEGLVDQGDAVDDEAGVLQPLGRQIGQTIVVFDEEHAHRRFRPGDRNPTASLRRNGEQLTKSAAADPSGDRPQAGNDEDQEGDTRT